MGPPGCLVAPLLVAAAVAAPKVFRGTTRLGSDGRLADCLSWFFGPLLQPFSRPSSLLRPLLTSARLSTRSSPRVRCMNFRPVPSGSTRCVFRCRLDFALPSTLIARIAASLPVRVPTVVPSLETSFALSASRHPPCPSLRLLSRSPFNTFQLMSSRPCRAHWCRSPTCLALGSPTRHPGPGAATSQIPPIQAIPEAIIPKGKSTGSANPQGIGSETQVPCGA